MAQPQRCDRLLHRTELSSRVIVHVRACVRAYRQPAYRKVYRLYPIKSSCFLYFFQFFYIPIICCLLYNHHRCTESALNRAWRTMHSYMPHAQSQMSRLARTCAEWLKNNTIIDIQRFPTFWKRSSRKHKGKQQPRLTLVQQLWCSAAATSSPGYKRFSDIPFASDRMLQPFLNILFVYRVSVFIWVIVDETSIWATAFKPCVPRVSLVWQPGMQQFSFWVFTTI